MSEKDQSSSKPVEDKTPAKGKSKALGDSDSSKETTKDAPEGDEVKIGAEEELNEEDQKLKDDLDMLVERLLESDKTLYKQTLNTIKDTIKTSTSSMTAVPKPLKFLRPHYTRLTEAFEEWPAGDDKVSFPRQYSIVD